MITDKLVTKFDKKGKVIGSEHTRETEFAMVHVIAVLVMLYGPQVMHWFKTEGVDALGDVAGGIVAFFGGIPDYVKDFFPEDEVLIADEIPDVPEDWKGGLTEDQAVAILAKDWLSKNRFYSPLSVNTKIRQILNTGPLIRRKDFPPLGPNICKDWERSPGSLKKAWRIKWKKPDRQEWPGC